MTTLTRGQNAPLPTTSFTVTVDVGAPADLSALLLATNGRVRGDADIVFFNQPEGPGVRCIPPQPGRAWQLQVDLTQVPPPIEKVRVITSLEETGRTFGTLPAAPVAVVTAPSGQTLASAPLAGLSTESIVIAIEFYRRDGGWKIRSVGQGYAGGLDDLLRDHGVDVADEPAPAPTQAPSPAPVRPPAPAPTPAVDPYAPAAATSAPVAAQQPGLTRGRPVNLSKGQSVNLRKDDGVALSLVRMGLGWDPITRSGMFSRREADIDLDASAILLADYDVVDMAFYNHLTSADGSIRHTGDNRTGQGDGDDESIVIDLQRVPVHVTAVLLVVTSYEGQTFQMVQNAFCRLVDEAGRGGEMARYNLSGGAAATGMVMAALRRDPNGWRMQAIGEPVQARVPQEIFPLINRFAR